MLRSAYLLLMEDIVESGIDTIFLVILCCGIIVPQRRKNPGSHSKKFSVVIHLDNAEGYFSKIES